jgi:hypothetical protein
MSAIGTPHMCKFDRIVKVKHKMGRYWLDENFNVNHGFKLAIV